MKTKFLLLGATALIAWSLKRHYAGADVDNLWWILNPTARLVGMVTGASFVMQPDEGYFSRERLFLIEKSCAGINFMIAAFTTLVFALLHRVRSTIGVIHVVVASLTTSYAAAVLVNTFRITVAMWLAGHPVALSTFSPASVHRIEGITVYFAGLVLLYEMARALDRRVVVCPRILAVDVQRFKVRP